MKTSGKQLELTSVVIPVYNQYEYTAKCLSALRRATPEPHELIVVDNGSADKTASMKERPGVRVLRLESNLGYAAACNAGARAARGRYVLFLNNDTEPRSGWMGALLRGLAENPRAGIAGGKSIDAQTGLTQATGFVFNSMLEPRPVFSGLDPSAPVVNRAREFQALPGVFLCMERELFLSIGGFDHGLMNCFEDVALCLSVRRAGRGVIYCPDSEVLHYGSVTLKAASSEARKNAAEGRKRFSRKWKRFINCDDLLIGEEDEKYMQEAGIARAAYYGFGEPGSLLARISSNGGEFRAVRELRGIIEEVFIKELKAKGVKRVICWGASESGELVIRAAEESGVAVAGVVDADVSRQGRLFLGRRISPPEKLGGMRGDLIVICSTGYFAEICKIIEAFNVNSLGVVSF